MAGRLIRGVFERVKKLAFSAPQGCLGCGICCDLYGGHLLASQSDLERWERQGRTDLLAMVNHLGWIWVDPHTGERLELCPFLDRKSAETALCSIHDTKPDLCRSYPTLAHNRQCVRGFHI